MNNPIEVILYETAEKQCPFENWLAGLKDKRGVVAIETRLARVRAGNFGDAKALGDFLYELRIDVGPGYRVYYGREENGRVVLLLSGGDKKGQSRDIRVAREYWDAYRQREKNDETL